MAQVDYIDLDFSTFFTSCYLENFCILKLRHAQLPIVYLPLIYDGSNFPQADASNCIYLYSLPPQHQAHFPSKAITPAPTNTQTIINVNLLSSLVSSGLNKKSLASNSTNPV